MSAQLKYEKSVFVTRLGCLSKGFHSFNNNGHRDDLFNSHSREEQQIYVLQLHGLYVNNKYK